MQKTRKITETLANGYSSESTRRELSNEYQDNRISMVFQESCLLVLWMKVVSALEGLNHRSRSNSFILKCLFTGKAKRTNLFVCVMTGTFCHITFGSH